MCGAAARAGRECRTLRGVGLVCERERPGILRHVHAQLQVHINTKPGIRILHALAPVAVPHLATLTRVFVCHQACFYLRFPVISQQPPGLIFSDPRCCYLCCVGSFLVVTPKRWHSSVNARACSTRHPTNTLASLHWKPCTVTTTHTLLACHSALCASALPWECHANNSNNSNLLHLEDSIC